MRVSTEHHPNAMPYRWMGRTLMGAARRGLRSEDLVRTAGIAQGHEGPLEDAFVDPAEYMLMCGLLITAVDDEMHDTTRSRMRVGTASLGASVTAGARTYEEAVDTLIRFFDVTGTYCLLGKARIGDDILLTIRVDVEKPELVALIEEMTATYLHAVLSHFLGFAAPLAAFHTTAADHPDFGREHAFLRCNVISATTSALRIPREFLALPRGRKILEGNFSDCIHAWAAGFGASAERHRNAREAPVSAALFRLLLQRDLDADASSRVMKISVRGLRSELSAEGSTFRSIRRAALLERCQPHLANGANVEDVALSLGYADGRSLRRAVKLAGGGTLSDFRKRPAVTSISSPDMLSRLRTHYAQVG